MDEPALTDDLAYLEDTGPGTGRRSPARAWVETDAPSLSLDGDWRFRWSPSPVGLDAGFADPAYDDGSWDTLPVPSHWVLHGDPSGERPAACRRYRSRSCGRLGGPPPVNVCSPASSSSGNISSAWSARSGSRTSLGPSIEVTD